MWVKNGPELATTKEDDGLTERDHTQAARMRMLFEKMLCSGNARWHTQSAQEY